MSPVALVLERVFGSAQSRAAALLFCQSAAQRPAAGGTKPAVAKQQMPVFFLTLAGRHLKGEESPHMILQSVSLKMDTLKYREFTEI